MRDDNPALGCQLDVWNDLSEDEQVVLNKIHEWDFSFISGDQMLRHGVSNRYIHDAAVLELKKFLAIKTLRDPHPMGCFGPIVAAAWHAFILDTQRYEQFCSAVYEKTIHHKPSNYGAGVQDNTIWMSMYKEWFGEFPKVWKLDIDGGEIPGYEHLMNVKGNVGSDDMDSDDGAFAVINPE